MKRLFIALAAFAPVSAFGLASFLTGVNLPAGLRNAVVRVGGSSTTKGEIVNRGTGTVIDIKDGVGGKWYCILTADHVAGTAAKLSIAFGDGSNDYTLKVEPENVKRGPGIDLAVVGVFVPNSYTVPSSITPPMIGAASAAKDNEIVMAGVGQSAQVGFGDPAGNGVARFAVTENSWGYNAAYTSIKSIDPKGTSGGYNQVALIGTCHFIIGKDPKNNDVIVAANAYFLSGDSGGPSFQKQSDNSYKLVGVHAASQGHNLGLANEYNIEGDEWYDVAANEYYKDFIKPACMAVTPEPASLVPLLIGLAFFVRNKART